MHRISFSAFALSETTSFQHETKAALLADPSLPLNSLLAFVALNFFLLLSLWTKIMGIVASAFVVAFLRGWLAFTQIPSMDSGSVSLDIALF